MQDIKTIICRLSTHGSHFAWFCCFLTCTNVHVHLHMSVFLFFLLFFNHIYAYWFRIVCICMSLQNVCTKCSNCQMFGQPFEKAILQLDFFLMKSHLTRHCIFLFQQVSILKLFFLSFLAYILILWAILSLAFLPTSICAEIKCFLFHCNVTLSGK